MARGTRGILPRRLAVAALVGLAVNTVPALAQPGVLSTVNAQDTLVLTLGAARRLAVSRNPSTLADREEIAIATAGLVRARVFPFNPDLSLQRTGRGGTAEAVATQELQVFGQRGLRVDAAQFGVGRAVAFASNAQRLAVFDASIAFVRAIAAERRLSVTRDGLALVERLLSAVRIQLREGEISTLEANLAEIELGRARARVFASQRVANTHLLDLKRVTGLRPDVTVQLAVDSMERGPLSLGQPGVLFGDTSVSVDTLVAAALRARPDLAASHAAVREFEALGTLARRDALPNLRVGVVAESEKGTRRVGPVIGVSVPLFNRNRGAIAERDAQRRQAAYRQQAVELRVRTEVVSAVRAYRTASDEATVFEQSVRQPSHENAALLELAYRAGKIPLPTLLLLRNQLLEGELGYWDAWLARQEALAQLQAATATLPTSDSTINSPRAATAP